MLSGTSRANAGRFMTLRSGLSALGLLLSVAPLTLACSSAEPGAERVGAASSAVQGGVNESSATFAMGIASRMGGVCTGTLIAPNLILTARHCVVPPDGNEGVTCADTFPKSVSPQNLGVTSEANLFRARSYHGVKEIITPSENGFCGNDIALLILTDNVPPSEAKPATPVVQFSFDDERITNNITAVGYGITSPSANDSGMRRSRKDIGILCIPGVPRLECVGQLAQFLESDKEFVTEGWVCSGDSGGGAFEQTSYEKGEPYVLGTLSRGPQTADRCLAAIYTRTDKHAKMIQDAGIKAASEGGYPAPAWTRAKDAPPPVATPDSAATPGECQGEGCAPAEEAPPTVTRTTTTGCAQAPLGANGTSSAAFFGLALVGAAIARRRRD